MKIILELITITNFKGIEKLEVEFSEKTVISGTNGVGKTTIYDAFLWCLFGKDSKDRMNYELSNNTIDYNAENQYSGSVLIVLDIDGTSYKLERTARQNWVKRRGDVTLYLDGFDYGYSIDDVPCQATEYKEFIASIINEDLFKLLTNTSAFTNLKPEIQRQELGKLIGEIDTDAILSQFPELKVELETRDIEAVKARIKAQKTPIKEQIKQVPSNIETLQKQLPVTKTWSAIEKSIKDKKSEIETIESEMMGAISSIEPLRLKRSEERAAIDWKQRELANKRIDFDANEQKAVSEIKKQIANIEADNAGIDSKNKNIERSNSDKLRAKKELESSKVELSEKLKVLNDERKVLLSSFNEINGRLFTAQKCNFCGQELPEDKVEEFRVKFETQKRTDIQNNIAKGKAKKTEIENCEEKIKEAETKLLDDSRWTLESMTSKIGYSDLTEKLARAKASMKDYSETEEYKTLQDEIKRLTDSLTVIPQADNMTLIARKRELQSEIEALQSELKDRETIEKLNSAIKEEQKSKTILNQELANLERLENQAIVFERQNASMLEEKANEVFAVCKFQLFDFDKSGNMKDICEPTLNGVKFSTLSNGEKVLVGLDIINTLSNHYDLHPVIFIDNAEGFSKEYEINSQVVELRVVKGQEILQIENI